MLQGSSALHVCRRPWGGCRVAGEREELRVVLNPTSSHCMQPQPMFDGIPDGIPMRLENKKAK